MDYFKRAASAVLSQAGGPFPGFTIREREPYLEARTIWSLHSGTKREDNSPCSILIFDSTLPAHNPRRNLLPLAKNACRKFRTMRHPDVLKFIDSFENEKAVYIAVEKVRPLGKAIEDQRNRAKGREEWIGWGIRSVATALHFINESAGSTHGNVRLDSIFLSASGEWRLGGFEVLSSVKDEGAVLYNLGGLLPDASRFAPPEVKQGGWGPLRELETHALDSYSFALLILEAYNGSLPPITGSSVPPAGKVPPQMYTLVKRMMVPNAKARGTSGQLLAAGETPGGFFAENRLVKVAIGLDGFVLAREEERAEVMRQLKSHSDSFPPEFTQYKVLPALVHALSLASNGQHAGSSTIQATKILPLVLQLGSALTDVEWNNSLTAPILAAYKSPDRGVRMALLENLELYSERLEPKRIVDGVWPNLITGFSDSAAAIREATVKAILPLAPKLSERILNNDLLRQLAKTQVDPEPGIRTNTTILLGRLSPNLSLNTRRKVLVPAFSRSLKDPFLHARMAGLMALMATGESYERDDMARLIVPAIAPCLVDQEKVVRDQAKQGVNMFLKRIEAEVASMPDTVLPSANDEVGFGAGNSSASSASTSPMPFAKPPEGFASTAGGAASVLAGWTMSAFAKQI
ncbi:ARM repeat-containing protein, partial [Ceraceosorus guamensis]